MNFISSVTESPFVQQVILRKEKAPQDLDPVSTVVSCALLQYKTIGTKLSINEHQIYFQDPKEESFIGLKRAAWIDSHEDYPSLLDPIKKFIEIYNPHHPSIARILRATQDGLAILKTTYGKESRTTCETIERQIECIQRAISESLCPEPIQSPSSAPPKLSVFRNLNLTDSSKNPLWSEVNILVVTELLTRDNNDYLAAHTMLEQRNIIHLKTVQTEKNQQQNSNSN